MRYDSWPLSPCPPATFPATQASSVNSPEKWNPGMDLNASRNALTQFLENGKGQVLGLSGRWGAGKTHLWLSLRDTLPAAKTALYASCFGLKSPDEIGRALLQDAASNASRYGEAGGKVIKETGKTHRRAAQHPLHRRGRRRTAGDRRAGRIRHHRHAGARPHHRAGRPGTPRRRAVAGNAVRLCGRAQGQGLHGAADLQRGRTERQPGQGMARRAGEMPGRGDQSSAHADRCLRTRPGSRLRGPCGDPGHSPPAGPDEHTDHQAPGAADRHIQAAHVRTGSPLHRRISWSTAWFSRRPALRHAIAGRRGPAFSRRLGNIQRQPAEQQNGR